MADCCVDPKKLLKRSKCWGPSLFKELAKSKIPLAGGGVGTDIEKANGVGGSLVDAVGSSLMVVAVEGSLMDGIAGGGSWMDVVVGGSRMDGVAGGSLIDGVGGGSLMIGGGSSSVDGVSIDGSCEDGVGGTMKDCADSLAELIIPRDMGLNLGDEVPEKTCAFDARW